MAELRRRAHDSPAPPIELADREVDRLLSTSPRADVYLYRDAVRRHPVAVKIRRDAVGDGDGRRDRIGSAVDRLAALSAHPAMATVHGGGVAPDGRPYIVMEYCSRADLAESTARQVPTVADTLRLIIQLSGAVESAHRSGIVHRRVAIENVLTTDYGWPALIGFDADALASDRPAPDAAARALDVHGLAVATSELLTGRPIAEATSALPSEDAVPADLEEFVLDVLERTRAGGGPSAADFARALQDIEVALHLPLTHLDIRDPDDIPGDDDHTVLSTRRDDADDDRTILSTRRDPADDDHTVLSTRRDPADEAEPEHTVLSSRHTAAEAESDRTVLSPPRGGADDDEHTRLSSRHDAPDHTVLSARHQPDAADHTVLSTRAAAADGAAPAAAPSPLPVRLDESDVPAEPETVWVRRQAKDRVVRGRLDTPRQASAPDAARERYRVREAASPAPVARTRVEAPVRETPATPARRRRRGTAAIIAVVGGGILVLGAAATTAAILIGGAP